MTQAETPWWWEAVLPICAMGTVALAAITTFGFTFPNFIKMAAEIAEVENISRMDGEDLAIILYDEGLLSNEIRRQSIGSIPYQRVTYRGLDILCRWQADIPSCDAIGAHQD